MKIFSTLVLITLLSAGVVLAEERHRFELSGESGRASVLSGPGVKDFKNTDFRFGFAPNKEFQLTATYSSWDGQISTGDSLGQDFARDINKERPSNSQIIFRNTNLDENTIEFRQIEIGVVRSIEIDPKHWEGFVGLGIGVQDSTAKFTWRGPCRPPGQGPTRACYIPPANDPNARPKVNRTDKNEFLTTVRGGVRYSFIDWFGLQVNFKWVPIAKMFGRNYNGLELNAGLMFRFGKL